MPERSHTRNTEVQCHCVSSDTKLNEAQHSQRFSRNPRKYVLTFYACHFQSIEPFSISFTNTSKEIEFKQLRYLNIRLHRPIIRSPSDPISTTRQVSNKSSVGSHFCQHLLFERSNIPMIYIIILYM